MGSGITVNRGLREHRHAAMEITWTAASKRSPTDTTDAHSTETLHTACAAITLSIGRSTDQCWPVSKGLTSNDGTNFYQKSSISTA